MSEWISIAQWDDCTRMARPGIVFEIRNANGQIMRTPCVQPLPPAPFDWRSPPLQFRAVTEPKPQHSAPIPPPRR